ncbi:MAG: non-heme iron oxygenase ferredoxin subunit [Burkholderiaceae bacterium]|nr:non-heme iron oxygenase ferredoxin subunit [Burkholderiaceae bacterium]
MTTDNEDGWTDVAAAADLAPDDVTVVAGPGGEIALYSIDGEVFATDNLCTHGHARLCEGFLLGHEIECPLHQGRFDVRSGQPTCDPAALPVRSHPVRIEGGRVWLKLG